jgi:hypothetical protein
MAILTNRQLKLKVQYLTLKPVYLPRRPELMAVHDHPTHDMTTLNLMKRHQRPQGVLFEPFLIWHLGSNQVWMIVYSYHIRITRSVQDVALNGHQWRRVNRNNGLAAQLSYGPLTHEELPRSRMIESRSSNEITGQPRIPQGAESRL